MVTQNYLHEILLAPSIEEVPLGMGVESANVLFLTDFSGYSHIASQAPGTSRIWESLTH